MARPLTREEAQQRWEALVPLYQGPRHLGLRMLLADVLQSLKPAPKAKPGKGRPKAKPKAGAMAVDILTDPEEFLKAAANPGFFREDAGPQPTQAMLNSERGLTVDWGISRLREHSDDIPPAISAGYAFIMADLDSENQGPIQSFLNRNRDLLMRNNISLYTTFRVSLLAIVHATMPKVFCT